MTSSMVVVQGWHHALALYLKFVHERTTKKISRVSRIVSLPRAAVMPAVALSELLSSSFVQSVNGGAGRVPIIIFVYMHLTI